jgi:transposase
VKNVPGRKTDVNDAMWLAELLAHGLIRASFVPDAQTQEMRNLLRTRKQLVREQSSHVLRVQKTLEDANIKLDSVLTDLMGKSGRAIRPAHRRELAFGRRAEDSCQRFCRLYGRRSASSAASRLQDAQEPKQVPARR